MATIEDVARWYERDLSRYASWDNHVEIVDSQSYEGEPRQLHIRIYTDVHSYSIRANEPALRHVPLGPSPNDDPVAQLPPGTPTTLRMDDGYLGCVSTTRKPRAGEDWSRGNDLADGPLTERTWYRILGDIISYEMVRVHHREDAARLADIPIPSAA